MVVVLLQRINCLPILGISPYHLAKILQIEYMGHLVPRETLVSKLYGTCLF
jgi:hypothetical protein